MKVGITDVAKWYRDFFNLEIFKVCIHCVVHKKFLGNIFSVALNVCLAGICGKTTQRFKRRKTKCQVGGNWCATALVRTIKDCIEFCASIRQSVLFKFLSVSLFFMVCRNLPCKILQKQAGYLLTGHFKVVSFEVSSHSFWCSNYNSPIWVCGLFQLLFKVLI